MENSLNLTPLARVANCDESISPPGRGDCVPRVWNSAGCARATVGGRKTAVANPSMAARLLVCTVGCCHAVTVTENNATIAFSDSIVDAKVTSLVRCRECQIAMDD
mmetsp:Transcript_28949/g.44689  ORF Transcript_28949/g.44689 Transcript_28949/m.44689 type:complete len:106 (+) Transcript_28949:145-462(+)